jgi:predicted transcriptional regulator
MAMTLRLSDEEIEALRAYAEATGRSMQDIARQAIRDCVAERSKNREAILQRIVGEDAVLLGLLAK